MILRAPPLLLVAGAWLTGLTLAALGVATWLPVVILAGLGVCAGTALARREPRLLFPAFILFAIALFGVLRYESVRPAEEPGGIAVYNDGDAVRLLGLIDSDPEERPRSLRFVVRVSAVEMDGAWHEIEGDERKVLVTARQFPRYQYGDYVEMNARLTTPERFENFDYREYLAQRGIVSQTLFPTIEVVGTGGGAAWQRAVISLRTPLGESLKRSLPEPESALARGILLGQRASIPAHVNEQFNDSGLTHFIAISGYNVMLVATFVTGALAWMVGKRQATIVAMLVIVCYAAFVGGEASVLRATAMALIMLGATLAGRPKSALPAILMAAAILTLWRPLIIADVSFQLSVLATLGIVLRATDLTAWIAVRMRGLPMSSFIAEQLAVTTVASIAVLPVLAWHFERFSLVSLPANLLVGPTFAVTLLTSFAAAVAGALDETSGRIVGEAAYLPLAWMVLVARVTSGLPFAALPIAELTPALLLLVCLVLALGGAAFLLHRPKNIETPKVAAPGWNVLLTGLLLIMAASVWLDTLHEPPGRLAVTVLDIGQGDAILVESAAGHRILVDGGPSSALITQALSAVLPSEDRRIDLVVLTHPHDDHVTGLVEVLRRYDVGTVMSGAEAGESASYRAWLDEIERQDLPHHITETGHWLDLGQGTRIEVIGPLPGGTSQADNATNDNSVVLRVVQDNVSFLLTGDIEARAEATLLEAGVEVDATVLKLAHHGSDGSTTPAFLEAVSPALAVVSAGANNQYAHPTPTLRLRIQHLPLLRTDHHGHIRLETDGQQLWIDVQHTGPPAAR